MGSTGPSTVILPIKLGIAAAFDQDVFPLAYFEDGGNHFTKGCFLIRATLDEMEKIKDLRVDLKDKDFIANTKLRLEGLKAQKAKIESNRKTLNPFKALLNYRAARLFHEASIAVYLRTMRTSEKIRRDSEEECKRERDRMWVVPSTQMRIVNGAIPLNTVIGGISVDLPDGLSDDAKRTIKEATETIAAMNPFEDNSLVSQLRDDEDAMTLADTASLLSQDMAISGVDSENRTSVASSDPRQSHPTSPQTINVFIASSSVAGLTFNNGSQNSSGAPVTQEFTSSYHS